MKSIGVDKSSQVDGKDEVEEAVEKAKDAFEDAVSAGAVAAATIGAELISKIGEKLEQIGAIDFSKVKIDRCLRMRSTSTRSASPTSVQ